MVSMSSIVGFFLGFIVLVVIVLLIAEWMDR